MAQVRQQQAPYQVQPQPRYQQYVPPTPTNANAYAQQQQLPYAQQVPVQPQAPPQVTMENLFQAMHFWKGGPGAKADPDPCPNCGSNQYFSRAAGKRGPAPAPHCYNCGYNDGMFTQGEATTWGMTG
jgi:hypothetical protein